MAQYTITTLSILKSLSKVKLDLDYDTEFDSVDDFVHETCDLLFDNYPIFDEAYRHRLNYKIASHFLFEETNVTPYQRWRYMLNRKMKEIMPYYNELYKSTLFEFDPLGDTDIVETIIRDLETDTDTSVERGQSIENERQTDSSRNTQTDSHSQATENTITDSDTETWDAETPFNQSDAKGYANKVSGEKTDQDNTSTMSGTQSDEVVSSIGETSSASEQLQAQSETKQDTDSHEETLRTLKGKRSGISFNTLLKEYRDNLLNVDMMIIDELEVLFRFMLN